jgi:vitamin B12 transporter
MRRIVKATLIGVLVTLAAAGSGAAQETKEKLDPVVVTATKIEEPQERLGATVTVITEDELRLYNYSTAGDALRQVPGLEVTRSGGIGKLTQVRVRGTGTQQVQVLIDGMRVNSPTAGGFDLSDLGLDQIDRIEIIRGPQSTLYGADAIGGVIHIITKRGQGPFSIFGSGEAGNYETYRVRGGFSGSYKIFDYAVSGSWIESDGRTDNDASQQGSVNANVGLTLPFNGHLGIALRYNSNWTELPVDFTIPTEPFFVGDPNASQRSETTTVSVVWDQKPLDWLQLRARYGLYTNLTKFSDPFTAGDVEAGNFDAFQGDSRSKIYTERQEFELLGAVTFPKWNTLTVGGEYKYEYGRNESVGFGAPDSTFSKSLETWSVFAQDELRLFDRVILSGGVRYDDNNQFGDVTTSRVGAVVLVKETGTKGRGTWGQGFRAPTINDLFFPGFSNPDLRPEESTSWEVGVDQALWKNRIRLGATYFNNVFEDLIQFVFAGGVFRPVNVGEAESQGVEITAAFDVLDQLSLTGNYTYVNARDLTAGTELRRVPHHVYNVGINWSPMPTVSLYTQANVVSSQFEGEGFPRNPGYYRIDVGGIYQIIPKRGYYPSLDFLARINNVTDQKYSEVLGFRALGINTLVGLQARY